MSNPNPTPRDWAALPFLLLFMAIKFAAWFPMMAAILIGGPWMNRVILKVEYRMEVEHD